MPFSIEIIDGRQEQHHLPKDTERCGPCQKHGEDRPAVEGPNEVGTRKVACVPGLRRNTVDKKARANDQRTSKANSLMSVYVPRVERSAGCGTL